MNLIDFSCELNWFWLIEFGLKQFVQAIVSFKTILLYSIIILIWTCSLKMLMNTKKNFSAGFVIFCFNNWKYSNLTNSWLEQRKKKLSSPAKSSNLHPIRTCAVHVYVGGCDWLGLHCAYFIWSDNHANKNRLFCFQYPLHILNVWRDVATSFSWLYVLLFYFLLAFIEVVKNKNECLPL